jgi:hypothetical protein
VDYIGTQTINSGLLGTDGQHEGHSGWRIDQLDTPMAGWLNTLAASLDIPSSAFWQSAQPAYSVDHRARIGTFDRVAYYMELQTPEGQLQYLWASMDAFTTDLNKIGVPTLATGAVFQQPVANLNVVSNVAGVVNGTGLTGNLEFWPANYQPANSAGVTGASATLFDFGDQPSAGTYGSMQLHNAAAGQTLFALNNWGAGSGGVIHRRACWPSP